MAPKPSRTATRDGERAAIESLRAQIAKLERELSGIVVAGFPHVAGTGDGERPCAPRLLTLGELEQIRDRLVQRVHDAQCRTATRAEFERRSRALLERMKLEPGRYKFVRLPAADVGESGCGVYHVRPRLGIIGMLAGWWELKLSSGCPLAGGPRTVRGPASLSEKRRWRLRGARSRCAAAVA